MQALKIRVWTSLLRGALVCPRRTLGFLGIMETQRSLSGGGKNLSWILKGREEFGSSWERHSGKRVLQVQGLGHEDLVVNSEWFLGGDICKSVLLL